MGVSRAAKAERCASRLGNRITRLTLKTTAFETDDGRLAASYKPRNPDQTLRQRKSRGGG